jgi:hypothetical protein
MLLLSVLIFQINESCFLEQPTSNEVFEKLSLLLNILGLLSLITAIIETELFLSFIDCRCFTSLYEET